MGDRRGVDAEKLRQKVDYLRDALRQLQKVRVGGREAFLQDQIIQAAAIHFLQTSIEAMVDASNHVITREGWGLPQTYKDTVDILLQEQLLPAETAETFRQMVRFRNRIVHLYDQVDAEQVWRILEQHLEDFDVFLAGVVERYF